VDVIVGGFKDGTCPKGMDCAFGTNPAERSIPEGWFGTNPAERSIPEGWFGTNPAERSIPEGWFGTNPAERSMGVVDIIAPPYILLFVQRFSLRWYHPWG
jgi:hypothetical protein